MHRPLLCAFYLLAACLLTPLSAAWAIEYEGEEFAPFMVGSLTSFDEVIDDLTWIAQTAGFDQQREMAEDMTRDFVRGVSFDAPMGVLVSIQNGDQEDPLVLAFVPVDDIDPLLDRIEQETGQRPEADADGIYTLEAPEKTIYARLESDFFYFTNELQLLDDLPSRPQSLLGDLPKRYTLAVQFNVNNIPEDMRQELFDEMEQGFEEGFRESFEESDDEFELSEELQEHMLIQQREWLMRVVRSSQSITFGVGVDTRRGSIFLDAELLATEGSPLAEDLAARAEVTTEHSGFLLPDAAASLNYSNELSAAAIETMRQLFDEARVASLEEIEKTDDFEDEIERDLALEYTEDIFDVLDATIEAGKLDGGAALLLEAQAVTFVAGGRVADAETLQDVFLEALENDVEYETLAGESFEYAGVEFQTIFVPMEDAESRQVFGNEMTMILGFDEEAIYLGCGDNCKDVLKAVIDGSHEAGPIELPPFQMNVALTPIIRFAAAKTQEPTLNQLALTLETLGGKDRIMVTSSVIENGMQLRLEIEQGVIEATGDTIRMFMESLQGAGAPAGGF